MDDLYALDAPRLIQPLAAGIARKPRKRVRDGSDTKGLADLLFDFAFHSRFGEVVEKPLRVDLGV